MSDVYEIVSTSSEDANKLTVDFTFSSDVSKEDAVAQIDSLVSLADDNAEIEFVDHEPKFWEISQFN